MAHMALDMYDELRSFNEEYGEALDCELGHTGPVVAGVMGKKSLPMTFGEMQSIPLHEWNRMAFQGLFICQPPRMKRLKIKNLTSKIVVKLK